MEFEVTDVTTNPEPLKELYPNELQTLPIIDAFYEPYQSFFQKCMSKNVPCIIKNVSNRWNATEKWVLNGKPDVEYMNQKYGLTKVVIYNCSERYFNSQKCREGTLADYLELWRNKPDNNLYYLKDWHLKLQSKNDDFYQVPLYFASDWLNEYFIHCTKDDYRFVYMGQQGTWTPLHADVFSSYSWSVNVCGRKRWVLFPPGEESFLKDELNNIPYDIEEIAHSRKHFEVIQSPGEAIFVPSGWYHQVWNLEDTISVNHNWVNGCNINNMWESLKNNLDLTKKEIDDCKEMDNFEDHCQTMLKALFGIDYAQFSDFLTFIAQNRLDMVNNVAKRTVFHGHTIGLNHIMFDLSAIHRVLEDFLNCDGVNKEDYVLGQSLLKEIMHTLKNKNISS